MKNVNVRGNVFSGATFTKKLNSHRASVRDFSLLVEGAVKQAALHYNFDWANRLFEQHEYNDLLKQDGTLSVKGKAVRAYVVFHAPAIKIEREESGKHAGQWRASFTKSDKQRGKFVAALDDDGGKVFSDNMEEDTAFSFAEWQNRQKKKNNKAPSTKATTLVNQLEKALGAFDADADAPLQGDIETLRQLEVLASKLAREASARWNGMIPQQAEEVDGDAAARVATVKPQASKRAGNKAAQQ